MVLPCIEHNPCRLCSPPEPVGLPREKKKSRLLQRAVFMFKGTRVLVVLAVR